MIWYYLLLFFGGFFSGVMNALHIPLVQTLPFGMDTALYTAIGYFNFIAQNVPPILIIFNCVMVYLSYKVLIFALRQFRIFK